MTRRWAAIAALASALAASGCAQDNTPEGRCRAQAYEDPDVKAAIELGNTQLSQVRIPAVMQQKQLVKRSVQRCLAAQGLAPAGGVEPVQRY